MSSQTTSAPTPTPAPAPIPFQAAIAKLAMDELNLFLPLLDNFFTALQQPGANTQTVVQDLAKEKLAALQNVPQAESTGIADTAAAAQSQLHSLVNKAVAAAAPATSGEPTAGATS